jgi:hypothetical protein
VPLPNRNFYVELDRNATRQYGITPLTIFFLKPENDFKAVNEKLAVSLLTAGGRIGTKASSVAIVNQLSPSITSLTCFIPF